MRIRSKKWAENEIMTSSFITGDCTAKKGFWPKPLHLEIGCGKGGFIIQSALINSGINFVGIERQSTIAATAARKIRLEAPNVKNLTILIADVSRLAEIFDENEVSRLYINFCDPWPKTKWTKRRLTHRDFLSEYKKVLSEDGCICFKTDNSSLFEFSLNEFCLAGWKLKNITFDLHSSKWWNDPATPEADKLMTEYERKFTAEGIPIYRLEAWV